MIGLGWIFIMKNNILSALILIVLAVFEGFAQNAEEGFYYSVKGTVSETGKIKKVCVNYQIVGNKSEDCAAVVMNKFDLRKKISQPILATISTDNPNLKPLKIFLGNTDFTLTISNEIAFVAKPKIQTDFEKLIVVENIRPNYYALYSQLTEKNDKEGLARLTELFESFNKIDSNIAYFYFKNNPQSLLSVYAFERFATYQDDYSLLDKDFSQLPDWIKNSIIGKYVWQKIEGAKSVAINQSAPVFSQISDAGKTINLQDFKGKYVLIDFWASWCSPCRKEHPAFARIYKDYKSKNFEILSVSIDEDKTSWLNASKNDGIIWTNILDIKGQPEEIAVKYGVQAIPANFLVNPQGLIIAKNLKAEKLEEKLVSLLK